MSSNHANISIFVPHIGCPNKCSFCNQKYITGKSDAPYEKDITDAVNVAIKSKNYNPMSTEIAFFGGSFTAIDREYMVSLLEVASRYVENKSVSGIRISTRPDAIDDEVLALLKRYNVTSIELGAQSLDDDVLAMNNRGHTVADVENACHLIRKYGFELGLQIMTGLMGDTPQKAIKTAKKAIELSPDTVRIYPTIVLKNTDLGFAFLKGDYKPQSLNDAIELCSILYEMFTDNGIKVIRLGLHTIDESAYLSGPWHPAFSELCLSEIYYKKIVSLLKGKGKYIIFVNPSCISKAIGQKRKNIKRLEDLGYFCEVKGDSNLKDREIVIKGKCE